MSGLESLDHTVQLTPIWINDLDARLGWDNKPRSYRLLKATLHAIRDRLPINETVHLGAQLPGLLRGAYYEQWQPAKSVTRKRSLEDFLAEVEAQFRNDPLPDTRKAVIEVCHLLNKKVTPGEIKDVRHALAEPVRNLWPEPYREPALRSADDTF